MVGYTTVNILMPEDCFLRFRQMAEDLPLEILSIPVSEGLRLMEFETANTSNLKEVFDQVLSKFPGLRTIFVYISQD